MRKSTTRTNQVLGCLLVVSETDSLYKSGMRLKSRIHRDQSHDKIQKSFGLQEEHC